MANPTDRDLVRLYWPVELRPAFDALFAIHDAMAEVVARSTDPALGAIKLAWWRQRLEELDEGKVPAEPRLQVAAAELLPRGISGAMLAELEDGMATLLEETIDHTRLTERGAKLFAIAAILLGESDPRLRDAGLLTALMDAARHGYPVVLDAADTQRSWLAVHRFPRRLRPITALAKLAARDARKAPAFEFEGTPGRALALVAHRLTGRIG